MNADQQKTLVLDLLDGVRRSWWTVVAGVCVGIAAALAMLHYTPKVYEASTKIFAAAERIPQDYIRPTVTDDTEVRLRAIREAVLSRPYLLNIIETSFGSVPQDEEQLAILLKTIRSKVQVYYATGSRFFEIRYQDTNPVRAASVANALADFYIEENARIRTEKARGATDTLEELAEQIAGELARRREELAEFKARHLHDTADQMPYNLQMARARQADLEANRTRQENLQARLREFRAQEAQEELLESLDARAPVSDAAPQRPVTQDSRLTSLRAELRALRLRYEDSHPDVVAKRNQIAALEAVQREESGSSSQAATGNETGSQVGSWRTQIIATERELDQLKAEEQSIQSEIRMYERRIENAPRVQQQYEELAKGLAPLENQYNDYQSKIASARGAETVEETKKGTQFEVIERAIPPSLPVWPNPLRFLAVGVLAGLALFVGPVPLRILLRPVVGSEGRLAALAQVPVLVSIPSLPTPEAEALQRRRRRRNLGLSFLSILALAAVFVGLG